MSSKDFIAIAAIIRGDFESASPACKGTVFCFALSLADYFQRANTRFDRAKFYDAAFGTANLDCVRDRL